MIAPLAGTALMDREWKPVFDWENHEQHVNSEFELGKMLWNNVGVYGKALTGIGGDRSFDWGTTAAVRINF